MSQPFFQFRELTESDSHKVWVRDIKSQKMPRLSAPPCEVTPIFLPVQSLEELSFPPGDPDNPLPHFNETCHIDYEEPVPHLQPAKVRLQFATPLFIGNP